MTVENKVAPKDSLLGQISKGILSFAGYEFNSSEVVDEEFVVFKDSEGFLIQYFDSSYPVPIEHSNYRDLLMGYDAH